MPYLLKIITGKEKKVIELFALHHIELKRIPISEYLICQDPKCQRIRYLDTVINYIRNVMEISDHDAELLGRDLSEEMDVAFKQGSHVTVKNGEYSGISGIVKSIEGGMISVSLCLFGRLHDVTLASDQLEQTPIPEIWR